MYHKGAIENSPLQAYTSALLFSPVRSLIRGQDLGCRQWQVPTDARGPQLVGQLGRLLARLGTAGVGVRR
jgi:hypothetical protein